MSSSPQSIEELEAPDHLRHHQGEWNAERVGWVIISAVLAAAAAGLMGPGWISHRDHASSDGTLAVEYDGIGRALAPATLRVRLLKDGRSPVDLGESPGVHLALPRSFLDAAKIEHIVPEPIRTELRPNEVVYTLQAPDRGEPQTVVFHYEYQQFGSFRHGVRLVGKEPAEIRQWIFP